mgnify:CR=1 FL=1
MKTEDIAFWATLLSSTILATSGAITLLSNKIILGLKLLFSSFLPLFLYYAYMRAIETRRKVRIELIEGEKENV